MSGHFHFETWHFVVPMPPHNRKCQWESGMGSSCLIPRTHTQALSTRGCYSHKQPLSMEADNTKWERSQCRMSEETKGMFSTSRHVYIARLSQSTRAIQHGKQTHASWNLSFPKPCTTRLLPVAELAGIALHDTSGKTYLVPQEGMLDQRKCFMCHLLSKMWATAYTWEEAKSFVFFSTDSFLRENQKKKHTVMHSFYSTFNPNLTRLSIRLRSQARTHWFQCIFGWFLGRPEETSLILCDSADTVQL